MARIIFHVDLDSFYASVEVRENPNLAGRPLIVGADPKEGRGRGVAMAVSYEARALGIRSGMPISFAWRKAPDAVYRRPDYDLYGTVSESVMDLLREFGDRFEQASIDEAYLDVTEKTTWGAARDYAMAVKDAVREREGITCSVGVAPNKSTSKIAAGREKPDGLTVVRPGEVAQFLAPLPVTEISGVGQKTARVLEELGIRTIGDLAAFDGNDLVRLLGRNAVWLWGIARGLEELPVEERGDPKSISAERTFAEDVSDWDVIVETLDRVGDTVHRRVTAEGMTFRTVGIKIRFEGFRTHTRDRTLPRHTTDREVLTSTARDLLREFRDEERPVRLLGVRAAKLQKGGARQTTLPE